MESWRGQHLIYLRLNYAPACGTCCRRSERTEKKRERTTGRAAGPPVRDVGHVATRGRKIN